MSSTAAASGDAASIAGRLVEARRTATGLSNFPGDLPQTLGDAYAIQDVAIAAWGKPIVGWKVGRIHAPLSQRYGTDRLAGPIFLSKVAREDGQLVEMPVFGEGSAAGEAEFLLRIANAPDKAKTRYTLEETAELIDAVHIGIEIASSPVVAINDIGPAAVVSDFGNNNGVLIGPAIPDWRTSGFEEWEVTTRIDGELAGSGRASAFPNGAIGSARFLLELLAERAIALEPGQWISSGAVTGVHDAAPGQSVEAIFGHRLTVRCRLAAARAE